jgi:hypothetical protein
LGVLIEVGWGRRRGTLRGIPNLGERCGMLPV